MKNKYNNELAVCGFAAVKKLEKNHPEKITRLYFTEEKAPLFGGLCKKLSQKKCPYNKVMNEDLEKLCGSVHHQGVVAMIESPQIEQIDSDIVDSWVKNKENAVLLDRIGNANNFGAIVRSAAFFGIKNIIIPLDESQSSITTSSYRVAEGGMEYVNIYSVRSTARLLDVLKGKMIRVGTSLEAKKSVNELKKIASGDKPVLIILGNEEKGISDIVKSNCDEQIIIPFAGMSQGKKCNIDSLSVAQAASIIFYN